VPLFGEKCAICGKTGKSKDFIFDSETGKYYCSKEHLEKAKELSMLIEKAELKGLTLCDDCLKEIRPNSYACRHCGKIRVIIKDYEIGGMCPFTVVQVGSTQFGQGNYVWQHSKCMQEYCALWDLRLDKCSFTAKT
jgi:hypothetical protein